MLNLFSLLQSTVKNLHHGFKSYTGRNDTLSARLTHWIILSRGGSRNLPAHWKAIRIGLTLILLFHPHTATLVWFLRGRRQLILDYLLFLQHPQFDRLSPILANSAKYQRENLEYKSFSFFFQNISFLYQLIG